MCHCSEKFSWVKSVLLFSWVVGLQLSNLPAEAPKQLHRQWAGPCSPRSFGQAFCRESVACLFHCFLLFLLWTFCTAINEKTEQPCVSSEVSRWFLAQSQIAQGTAESRSSFLITEALPFLCFFRNCSPNPWFSLSLLLKKVLIP